jgi:hypothetical protein
LASGLIVGESVVLIVITAIVAFSSVSLALVGPGFETAAIILGGLAFALVGFLMYRWILGMGTKRTA